MVAGTPEDWVRWLTETYAPAGLNHALVPSTAPSTLRAWAGIEVEGLPDPTPDAPTRHRNAVVRPRLASAHYRCEPPMADTRCPHERRWPKGAHANVACGSRISWRSGGSSPAPSPLAHRLLCESAPRLRRHCRDPSRGPRSRRISWPDGSTRVTATRRSCASSRSSGARRFALAATARIGCGLRGRCLRPPAKSPEPRSCEESGASRGRTHRSWSASTCSAAVPSRPATYSPEFEPLFLRRN